MRPVLKVMWLGVILASVGVAGILFNHVWGGTWLLIVGGGLAIVSAAASGMVS